MYIVGSSWWYLNIFKAYMITYDIGWNDIGLLMGNDGDMMGYSQSDSHLATGDHHWKMSMRSAADSQDSALLQLLLFFFNLTLQAFHHRLRGRVKFYWSPKHTSSREFGGWLSLLHASSMFYQHFLPSSPQYFAAANCYSNSRFTSSDPTRAAPAASLCFAFQPPVAPELLPAVSSPHARTPGVSPEFLHGYGYPLVNIQKAMEDHHF